MSTTPHYQYDYSRIKPEAVFDAESRTRKARTIVSVLAHHFPQGLDRLSLLDVGCSSGIIADTVAAFFCRVTGIDIDETAIRFAQSRFHRPNLSFHLRDGLDLDLAENSFEVVLCAHVYEHVPNAGRLMTEIWRVLKPGGICYFAAGNRLAVREPHYGLLFLSWLPRPAADAYLRLFRKGSRYYENHRTVWGLRKLVRGFMIHDYTRRLVETPQRFGLDYLLKTGTGRHRLAVLTVRHLYALCPTYIWLLEKPLSSAA
jgi:2-polyprenyl-3-methyl-5-hydroxy-6-metoxy-1,4-benzoquinol methylase